jgi:hypothetical protein
MQPSVLPGDRGGDPELRKVGYPTRSSRKPREPRAIRTSAAFPIADCAKIRTIPIRERPLWRLVNGGNGSSTAERSAARNGGSMIRSGPSRVDDCSTLISSRSVTSLRCPSPATSGPKSTGPDDRTVAGLRAKRLDCQALEA